MREIPVTDAPMHRPAAPSESAPAESDESLAAAAARGERRAFDILVSRHAPRVYRFVLARLRDRHDAEEATQEAFLSAWAAIARYDARWRLTTWLYTIARRQAVNTLRRRSAESALRARPAPTPVLDPAAEARDNSPPPPGIWSTAAATLAPVEYEALWLRYAEDLEPAEIALVLGRTPVGVRVMLHRARRRLRDALENERIQP